jgi:hypothetical protein
VLIAVSSLVALAVFWATNPFNLGTTRSERFSTSRFKSVSPGANIAGVIELLGEPIEIVALTDCDGVPCKNYVFAGEPVASWVFGYAKAWAWVDNSGQVIRTIWYEEP